MFVAVFLGIIVILLTWWFIKLNLSLLVRNVPSTLTAIVAAIIFYIGYVNIRGLEVATYGILVFFLFIFAVVSFVIVNIKFVNN